MFGLFNEIGPYQVDDTGKVHKMKVSWADSYNMLFLDQPVGAGFSFTQNNTGYPINQDQVADNLYESLRQFYTLFPDLLNNDFYVSGESYAGKYVPAISYKIHQMNNQGQEPRIPLKGLAVGNGWSDPIHQSSQYGELLYQTGLVDESTRDLLNDNAKEIQSYLETEHFDEAIKVDDRTYSAILKKTGFEHWYNYVMQNKPKRWENYKVFLNRTDVRKGIHVGKLSFKHISFKVYDSLKMDIMKSIVQRLKPLLDNGYKVMYYNGLLDVSIPATGTEEMLANLDWKGKEDYLKADRIIWRVGDNVAGYTKKVMNFTQVLVRNAGHMVPFDQPEMAFDMISRFIDGQSFNTRI